MTGGSQAEARAIVPPRLGGLVLAGIQSGYETGVVWAKIGRRLAPTNAVAPTPPHPARLRKLRRFRRRPSLDAPRSAMDIAGSPSRSDVLCRHLYEGKREVDATVPHAVGQVKRGRYRAP